MNQLCDDILHQPLKTSIKNPLIKAYVFKDIDLGDEIISAGQIIELIDHLEGSVYLARSKGTLYAVSTLNEVRILNKEREV